MYNSSVTTVSVDEESQTAHAFLANGEIMKADIIVGADGYRSVVRDVVTNQNNDGKPGGLSVLT
jgi:salicylate hydroxylase